jgi:hypothetical protein
MAGSPGLFYSPPGFRPLARLTGGKRAIDARTKLIPANRIKKFHRPTIAGDKE